MWGLGLSFVTLISLCAMVGILFMRLLNKNVFNKFITFFVSVGVGSLSGSAVFHLLPQAFGLVDEFDPNANHDYLYKAFAAIVGIYLFFFCDKAIKIILETKKVSPVSLTDLVQRRKAGIEMTERVNLKEESHSGRSSDALLSNVSYQIAVL